MTTSYPLRLTNTLPLANSIDYGKWYRNYPKNYNRSYLLCSLIFQYHDEQTSKQSNIQTSYKESQQAKQERPAVKSDFSSPKVERQGNTVQEKTVQKPATSTTTADRTSQRPITKERPSTVQRVPLQNTRSRPPIKTATIKKVGKKP